MTKAWVPCKTVRKRRRKATLLVSFAAAFDSLRTRVQPFAV